MKTAQEFRKIAIEKMSTPDMVVAAKTIESLMFDAINKGKNYISLNTGYVMYRDLCDLTKGCDNLKTYLELHGYTVSTSCFDGSSFFTVSF
jgi:hypothetical protein